MKKLLAVGVIVLFLGVSVIPSTGTRDVKQVTMLTTSGNTLYVGGNGTGNYTRIQDAIDNTSDGDTVYVYNGTYYENVVVDKSIKIVGENRNITIIDGTGKENGTIKITSDNVQIIRFTIQNSYESSDGAILVYNDYITIKDNIINENNGNGVFLYHSSYSSITQNTISNNTDRGVEVAHLGSNNNTISHNIIVDNSWHGIGLWHSDGNIINSNKIMRNNHGIKIRNSNNNVVYHNDFIENVINAYDDGSNTWDDGYPSGGNYWDDYNGTDVDDDGIGDTPYNISGGDNRDRYPLMEPYGMGDENETFFGTLGPICPFLNIAEINLIDGNSSQIQKIEKMLNNRILQFIIPRWWYINVTELNFTISYNKKIPMMPFFLRFYYATMLMENGNVTFIDKPHTVTVKGLNGQFTIFRGQPFRFIPPIFVFEGSTYDEVTIELQKGV